MKFYVKTVFIFVLLFSAAPVLFSEGAGEEISPEKPGITRTAKVIGRSREEQRNINPLPLPSRQNISGPAVHSMNPPENEKTDHYFDLFLSEEYREWLEGIYMRSRTYITFIQKTAEEHQIPYEIAYLPAVESAFRSRAVSPSGAVGLWQFMKNSIDPWNIEIDQWRDDRRDFVKSTRGAVQKLKYNHSVLGDWYLALAAYNCGLGRVQRTIASSGIGDFWELSAKGLLPGETVEYVPRFLAAAHILSYPGRYGLSPDWEEPIIWEIIPLDQAVDLKILAEKSETPLNLLVDANSELRYGITPPGSSNYELKVPAEYSDSIKEVLENSGERLIRFYIHPIASGDTFYALSRHFGIPVDMIMEYNPGVDPTGLRIGQKIVVPAFRETGPYRSETVSAAVNYDGVYTVAPGDSLWSISRSYGITPEELAENNGLDLNGVLKSGARIQVPAGAISNEM